MTHTFLERSELVPVVITCVLKERVKERVKEIVNWTTSVRKLFLTIFILSQEPDWTSYYNFYILSRGYPAVISVVYFCVKDISEKLNSVTVLSKICFFPSFHSSLSIHSGKFLARILRHLPSYTEQNEATKRMIRRNLGNRNWKSWEIMDCIKTYLLVKSTKIQSTHSHIIKVKYHLSVSLRFYGPTRIRMLNEWIDK